MARIQFRNFSGGWFPQGPRDSSPAGTLRRTTGLANPRQSSAKSRPGSTQVGALSAHSLYKFSGDLYEGAGIGLYRNDINIVSGLSGARLSFASMPPVVGDPDYLFVAGGGSLIKVSDAGAVSRWGIAPPTTLPTATISAVVGPLIGVYQYACTFANSVTGSRSNPFISGGVLQTTTTASVASFEVDLSNIPVSTDPQVDTVEIWRTVGGGTILFLLDTVANGVTVYTDAIADLALQSTQLPLNNNLPESGITSVWGPHDGRLWSCGNPAPGARGRVYFSATGLPESAEGFLDITSDDDPTQCGCEWNGSCYVFTEKSLYQITGTSGLYVPIEVAGAPGTKLPHTMQPSPYGIIYQADTSLRLFDGIRSTAIAPKVLGDLFNGYGLENVAAMTGVTSAANEDTYMLSDGAETLSADLSSGTWRVLGVGCTALDFDSEFDVFIGSVGLTVLNLEVSLAVTDAGTPINFEIETPGAFVDVASTGTLQRIYLDINTNGQPLAPYLILDEWVNVGGTATLTHSTIALPPVTTATRQIVEYSQNRTVSLVGVRLVGALTAPVEVFGIEADIYTPVTPQIEDIYTARAVATEERR